MSQSKEHAVPEKPTRRKRKRPRVSAEEQMHEEREEKYNKLVYMATKALHKEAKVVKSFECQKVVRKLKQQDGSSNQKLLQDRLLQIKNLSLDHVVDVCMQRLGVPNLNPNPEKTDKAAKIENKDSETGDDSQLLERMLQHKRLKSAIDTWTEKVTDYRRWHLRRQERVTEVPEFLSRTTNKKKASKTTKPASKRSASSASSDLFVCLSGATADNGESNHYGPGETGDEYKDVVKQKKNRPGQRSRKAKAMAIQARKEGRTWDSSLNWREKKAKPREDEESHQDVPAAPSKAQPEDIAAMGKTWKEEGKAHPSWAAQKSQKIGIVEFIGKKITFD